jgi:L-asparaginase
MAREDTIRILIAGGTIDKEYDPLTGELTFVKSHLSNMLNQVRCRVRVVLQEVMLKDSLQMRDEDREEILKTCINCVEDKILITHGTYTMVETARFLCQNGKGNENPPP